MNEQTFERGTPWQRAALLAVSLACWALACGEAHSPSQTADSASDVRQAQDESTSAKQTSTEQANTAQDAAASASDEASAEPGAGPQCHWPSSDPEEPGSCHAGRELARCTSPNGGAICISDEHGRCDGIDASFSCENLCASDEYALSCGGIPRPGVAVAVQQPPAACRSVAPTPGGVVFYCCPCE